MTSPEKFSFSQPLSWREIELLASNLNQTVSGCFLNRISVPERKANVKGFLLSEWCLSFSGKKSNDVLIHIRQGFPLIAVAPERHYRPSKQAPPSAFSLGVQKHLIGKKLSRVEAVDQERVIILHFDQLAIAAELFPAKPEIYLLKKEKERFEIIVTGKAGDLGDTRTYTLPKPGEIPEVKCRPEAASLLESFDAHLQKIAIEVRKRRLSNEIKKQLKQINKKRTKNRTAVEHSQSEPDWKKYGDLLKGQIYQFKEKFQTEEIEILDYETGKKIMIPVSIGLTPKQQLEKFYKLDRRKRTRREEATSRLENDENRLNALTTDLQRVSNFTSEDLKSLIELERSYGFETASPQVVSPQKRRNTWTGRSFLSQDGTPIWIGKSQSENQELVFRYGKGNDIWLHLKGRPSAHAIVPLPKKKSASLDTLLDAANLVIYFTGGKDWGKADVDYTFQKNVKRIKGSKEVSYSQNKTLSVTPDQERLKRLLGKDK